MALMPGSTAILAHAMPLRIAYAYVEVLVGITTEPPIARAIPPV